MLRFFTAGLCFTLLTALPLGISSAAVSPGALSALNFNLYPSPFPVNDMTLTDLKGAKFSLGSLRGKVIILNFWRIDCPPCAMEKPILDRLQKRFGSRGLVIIAVNLFDPHQRVMAYSNSHAYSFTLAYDPDSRFRVMQYDMGAGVPTSFVVNERSEAIYEVRGVPTTYIVNRSGQVLGRATGMANWEQPAMLEYIESLLGSPAQSLPEAPLAAASPARPKRGPVASPAGRDDDSPAVTVRMARGPQESAPVQPATPSLPLDNPPTRVVPERQPSVNASRPPARFSVQQTPPQPAPVAGAYRPADRSTPRADVRRPQASTPPEGAPPRLQAQLPLPPAQATSGSLEPLPQATPYVPSSSSTYSPPRNYRRTPSAAPAPPARGQRVQIDQNGYITAQVPAGAPIPTHPPAAPAVNPRNPGAVAPAAPAPGINPIGKFLLESFDPPAPPVRPVRQAAAPYPQQAAPQVSIMDPINRFGSGVKSLFSRILPAK